MKLFAFCQCLVVLIGTLSIFANDILANNEPLNDGAFCDVNVVRRANREHLHLLLEELVNTTFFRLYRVGLDGKCPFSDVSSSLESSQPESSSCGVASSSSLEPSPAEGQCSLKGSDGNKLVSFFEEEELVDRTISRQEEFSLESVELNCDSPDFWFDLCDGLLQRTANSGGGGDGHAGWINLQLNPERHTGYNGSTVWKQIYGHACFSEEDCQSERVLYRLLSGLHASVNTHISLFYHHQGKGDVWTSNPQLYMNSVGSHPDRIRNLNFAFVVLLRALKKASGVLQDFSYAVSEVEGENQRTTFLVRRLLETHLMSSCSQVFDSFDESSIFHSSDSSLKIKFKQAFQNIAQTFDCIKCQKCRLHGKMQLTGLGTALKILLLPVDALKRELKREEVVALFNTLHKISHSIHSGDFLTEASLQEASTTTSTPLIEKVSVTKEFTNPVSVLNDFNKVDSAIGAIARAYFASHVDVHQEEKLLELAIQDQSSLLSSLVKHYGHDAPRFSSHVKRFVLSDSREKDLPTVAVIGSGLAGSSIVLKLLDQGRCNVILIEKQATLGGNSLYASSGMNAVDFSTGDSTAAFLKDMVQSGGGGDTEINLKLMRVLSERATDALQWVRNRTGLDFSLLGKLGGHSFPRTHRPQTGLAGSELLNTLFGLFTPYHHRLEMLTSTRVVNVSWDPVKKWGSVQVENKGQRRWLTQLSQIVFATGGFAAGAKELLPPHLRPFKTTNQPGTTGDAIPILQSQGAKFVNLEWVQLHPTAFVSNTSEQQPLCAEILRGVGGVLLNRAGKRFCNELGTRAYVSQKMLEQTGEDSFVLLLSHHQAMQAQGFVDMYVKRNHLIRFETESDVAQWMNVSHVEFPSETRTGPFFVGRVRPALHYCMGGVSINEDGQVLNEAGQTLFSGALFAAGEVTGGVHGRNRLGGNGMTEALVFGHQVSSKIVSMQQRDDDAKGPPTEKVISKTELAKHAVVGDLWVSIRGHVYDLSTFDHPGGVQSILDVAGRDGTTEFEDVHTSTLLKSLPLLGREGDL